MVIQGCYAINPMDASWLFLSKLSHYDSNYLGFLLCKSKTNVQCVLWKRGRNKVIEVYCGGVSGEGRVSQFCQRIGNIQKMFIKEEKTWWEPPKVWSLLSGEQELRCDYSEGNADGGKEMQMEGAQWAEEREKEGGNSTNCSAIADRWVCLDHMAGLGKISWPG